MKKLNILTKIILSIMTTALLLCGSLSFNYSSVYAAETDWVKLVTDGVWFGNEFIPYIAYGTDSVAYEMPYYLKNLANNVTNLTQGGNFEQAAKLWYDMVITGKQNAENWTTIQQLSNYGTQAVSTYVTDGMELVAGSIAKGTATKKTSTLAKILMGCSIVTGISSAFNIVDKVKSWFDTPSNMTTQESGNKHYYTGSSSSSSSSTIYNTGDTAYYETYNPQTNTFYNTYSNRYETVNNYNYDINENYYTYNTTYNDYTTTYNVTNNYNNTYVFNTGGNYDYSLYYKLPDGSNSFNLTEDEIGGIRTDFDVDNYEINNSNSDVVGLFHFNGNPKNTYSSDSIFYNDPNFLPFASSNYVDSLLGFDLAIMTTQKYLFKFNSNYPNVRFKLFSSHTNRDTIELDFIKGSVGNDFIRYSNGKFDVVGATTSSSDIGNVYLTITNSSWHNIEINNYSDIYLDGLLVYPSNYLPKGTTISDVFSSNSNIVVNSISESIDFTTINVTFYGNSRNIVVHNTLNNLNIQTNSSGLSYNLVDELRLSNVVNSNHDVNFLPYSDGIYYTLPQTDTNNKVLIQSDIPVNNFQFGGIRESYSNSLKGDVYFYLVDGLINTIEQFDGHDWISVDGAIYNDVLGKWVNAIGFSINLYDWSYQELSPTNVTDLSSLSAYFSSLFTKLGNVISDGFNTINNKLDSILSKLGISSDDDSDSIDINEYIEDMQSYDEDVNSAIEDSSDVIDDLSELGSSVNSVFDTIHDNGYDILIVAPLIVCLIRMII